MPQMDYPSAIGFPSSVFPDRLKQVNLLLLANGLPPTSDFEADALPEMSRGFLEAHAEAQRLLTDYRCPVDRRIETYLAHHFADVKLEAPLRLPARTLVLSRHGIAREL